MGAGSSCAVFERFSTALQHIDEQVCKVHRCIHVLDDFLFISTGYNACRQDMSSFIALCESAGVPIAHDQTAGPAQVLEFLGVTVDVPGECARLPNDKVEWCLALLEGANTSRHVTLVHLQQLVGHLNFTCRAVVPGPPFLAAMYSVMKKISKPHHKAWLSALAKQDLVIWSHPSMAGHSSKKSPRITSYTSILMHLRFMDMVLVSEKSGSLEAGQRIRGPGISWCLKLTLS